MAEFKAGTREQVKNGQAQYVAGDIVAKDATVNIGEERRGSRVFKAGTKTRTKTVSVVQERDNNGNITKSKTIMYVEKNGSWQPAASKRDGKWNYSDPDYPTMAGVADAELQNELSNSNSTLNKVTNKGIEAELGKRADVLPTDVKKVTQGNQNGADPWEAQDNGLTGRPLNTETSPENVAGSAAALSAQKNTKTRRQFDKNLMFPKDLGSSSMDVIQFDMLEFKPRKITNEGALGGVDRRTPTKDRNSIGRVTLPVPAGIQDQNQAGWGDGRLNPIQAAGVNVALTAFNEGLGAAAGNVAQKIGDIGGNAEQLRQSVKGYFTAAAVGVPLDQILARTQGQVLNPNLELLFNGPTLRPFNFTFKMSARSGKESEEIVRIIRFFKQGMSPQRTDANLFVKAPHTFQLQYLHRQQGEHNFLNKFKECALIGMSVNYTPENNYATFEDGAMVSYEMQMQFKELDPVYNEDYTDLDQNADTQIGF